MMRYLSIIARYCAGEHLNHARIRIKVVVMALMALCMLVYIASSHFAAYKDMVRNNEILLGKLDDLSRYALFIHELQIERCLSYGASSKYDDTLIKKVTDHYGIVDKYFNVLPGHSQLLSYARGRIDAARNGLLSGEIGSYDIFNIYTLIIQTYFEKITSTPFAVVSESLHEKQMDYVHILLAKEYLGRLRAFVYRSLVSGRTEALAREVASGYVSFFSFYLDAANASQLSFDVGRLRELRSGHDFVSLMTLMQTWIAIGKIQVTPAYWFANSTKVIDSLQGISQAWLNDIEGEVQGALRESRRSGYLYGIVLLAVGTFVLGIMALIVYRIVTPLKRIVDFIEKRIETGDFGERLHVGYGNEFGVISSSLNGLLDFIDHIIKEKDRIAYHDSLTGIYNRYKFKLLFSNELHRANRYDVVFSFLILDIDHFKRINDVFGHNVGDVVLRELAHLLVDSIRHNDVLARWGGEEFVVLLPETQVANAARFAEKIRALVDSTSFTTVGHVTISVGVTGYVAGDTLDSLCGRADAALYAAKEQGRNKVTVRTKDLPLGT